MSSPLIGRPKEANGNIGSPKNWESSAPAWVSASRSMTPTRPFVRLTLGEEISPVDTCVLIGVSSQGTRVFAAGNEEAGSELIEHLAAASRAATRRTGDPGSEHTWTAILGYLPKRISGWNVCWQRRPLLAACGWSRPA